MAFSLALIIVGIIVGPYVLDFMDRGKGTKKGIPTLLLGASSVYDVFVIVLFTIFLGMYGGGEINVLAKLAEIPLSITLGILIRIIPGYLLVRLFQRFDWLPPKRTLLVMAVAILLIWLEHVFEKTVLSILVTAPLGAIGIMILGERILDHEERPMYRFKELREDLNLPRLGERKRRGRLSVGSFA